LDDVRGFIAELESRVRSVTVWNSVYKLRRASQLIAPSTDFGWLTEIEKDVALVMMPRSKADRVVLTERLVDAGLTLIQEAEMFGKTALARATGVRNGLLVVLLALHPIRIKNFAALKIAHTFVKVGDRWWLHIPSDNTKSHRVDERQVPEFITELTRARTVACKAICLLRVAAILPPRLFQLESAIAPGTRNNIDSRRPEMTIGLIRC
jgi:hypothetical protein